MRDFCRFWAVLVFCCLLEDLAAAPDLDLFADKKARVALVLTRPGCAPCARMKADLAGRKFAGFSLEWGSAGDRKWSAKAAPTTVKLVGGKEVGRREGYLSARSLEAWMAE